MMDSMQQMFAAFNARLDQTHMRPFSNGSSESVGTYLSRMVKLDFPKFNGEEDPTSWVCRADQFFEFHHTPEEDRVPLASFNLEGDAQLWYQLMKEEGGIVSWDDFKSSL
ncbi:hypothetical protein AMTRI_Chr02g260510 [Amborella trichopoda]